MVDQLVIGTAQASEPLRRRLERELAGFARDAAGSRAGLGPPQLTQHQRGSWVFFVCRLAAEPAGGRLPARAGREAGPEDDTPRLQFRDRLARGLAAYIQEEHRLYLMQRLLARRYPHLVPDERQAVLGYARARLESQPGRERQRQRLVGDRLAAYLRRAEVVLVEGFLRFRCREYVEELEQVVERAVDEFLLDREYRDFVRLLKQFVDVQEPRLGVVHVLMDPAGPFRLVDDSGRPVDVPAGASPLAPAGPDADAGDADDLLLSTLITVGAQRFVLHARGPLPAETAEMLEQVFAGRVETCGGCERCLPRSRRPVTPGP